MTAPNTSATGGYLTPAETPAPLQGKEFYEFLQQVFVGITGLPGDRFFSRWQPEPANWVGVGEDWASFGIANRNREWNAQVQHDPAANTTNGADHLRRNDDVALLVSFYGPNADKFADLLDDGLQIEQNRAVLTAQGMGMIGCGPAQPVPSLLKDKWQYRVDLPVVIKRNILREYSVLTIETAEIIVHTDTGLPDQRISVAQES